MTLVSKPSTDVMVSSPDRPKSSDSDTPLTDDRGRPERLANSASSEPRAEPLARFRLQGRWTDAVVGGLVLFWAVVGLTNPFHGWGLPDPAAVGLAILLIAATLWMAETVPLFVTSFLVLLLALVWLVPALKAAESGTTASATDFLLPFFSDTILLFLGGFVLSAGLSKYGLDERLARAMLSRTGTSVAAVTLGLMTVTALLSMFLSNTATAATMLALALPLVRGLPVGHPSRPAVILAISFGANIGGMGTPVGTPPNAIALDALRGADLPTPDFLTWMLLAVPGVVIMIGVAWGTLLIVFRGPKVPLQLPAATDRPLPKMASALIAVGAVVTIGGWVTSEWHGLSTGTVGLLPVIAFFGLRLLDLRDLRSLPWDVLLLMGGGICLGQVIGSSGLGDVLVAGLERGSLPPAMMLAAFVGLAVLLSSVMSNTAAANLILPLIVTIKGVSPTLFAVAVAIACSVAMPLPISTPPNALAFGSGQVTARQMLLPGVIVTVLGTVILLTLGRLWWQLTGLVS